MLNKLLQFSNFLAVVQKPSSGTENMNIVIIVVIVIILVLVAATIFSNKK